MINYLHKKLRSPEKGWDPISAVYAQKYAENEWNCFQQDTVCWLEKQIGSLEGKRILDLGGGPGQYSVAFAQKGAEVVWHDVSRNYMDLAGRKAIEHNVKIKFSLGYMDDAARLLEAGTFDLVFSRICWCYCISDRFFSNEFYKLVKPGGYGYINSQYMILRHGLGAVPRNIQGLANALFWIKIGHPHPPKRRIAQIFCKKPMRYIQVDFSLGTNEVVFFQKPISSESDND